MKYVQPKSGSSRAQITLRIARVSDAPELLRLIRTYYRFDGIRFQKSVIDAALRKLLRRRSLGRIWIMRDGVKPAGYVMLTFNYDLEFGGLEGIVTTCSSSHNIEAEDWAGTRSSWFTITLARPGFAPSSSK